MAVWHEAEVFWFFAKEEETYCGDTDPDDACHEVVRAVPGVPFDEFCEELRCAAEGEGGEDADDSGDEAASSVPPFSEHDAGCHGHEALAYEAECEEGECHDDYGYGGGEFLGKNACDGVGDVSNVGHQDEDGA